MKLSTVKLSDILLLENTRGEDQEVSNLMISIKERGVMQPVCLGKNFTKSKHTYVLAAGNRRYQAVRKLGMKEIPAVINPAIKDLKELMIVNLTENAHKKEVSAFEQGRFIHKLINEYDMTLGECAARIGVSLAMIKMFKDTYDHTPELFRQKVKYSSGRARSAKGTIPVQSAILINRSHREGHINGNQMKSLYKKVESSEYSQQNLIDVLKRVRKGGLFGSVVSVSKRVTTHTFTVPLLNCEKGDNMKKKIEALIYGESKDSFTRPRV